MRAFSLGIKSRLGFGRVVAALHAIYAVSEPRLSAVVAKGASELPSVADAGLVGAGHATVTETPATISVCVPTGVF